ncbi:MAG: M14 metallopeptidase family protein [Gemmatimonadaceae bacterium]
MRSRRIRSRLVVGACLATTPVAVHAQHAFSTGGGYDPAIPTPESILGYEVGERFTPHHMLMRYLDRLAATSRRVKVDTVAHTFEGRPVVMVIVTSEANQGRIEQIRADAARLATLSGSASDLDAVAARLPAISWLGFSVHGDEASGVEASIALVYQLAAGTDANTRRVLDETVVLIDPVQNPDGHERHVQDVMRMRTAFGIPTSPDARIHTSNWPGPRTSHYYFDMNRDWYIQSHPETRGRIRSMLEWWPHVAVDLHEMGSNSTYFFPPPMAPVNKNVHPSIISWWDVYAAANAEAFDRHGWSYFRREGYDEFYPGYGSSWPLYAGAIGMTYEQASSEGGAIRRDDGTVHTLRDATWGHYTTAWATVDATARDARRRVRDYLTYRRSAVTDAQRTTARTVIIERDDYGRADSLARRLTDNGIIVGRARAVELRGATPYPGNSPGASGSLAEAYVVDLAQPMGRLARAILEPDAALDSAFIAEELERRRSGRSDRFYDATAWSLPYTYRVRAWMSRGTVSATPVDTVWRTASAAPDSARYGYAIESGTEAGYRLLAALLRDSVRVWYQPSAFRAGTSRLGRGSFVARVTGNGPRLHELVRRHAAATGASVVALAGAGVDEGFDLGSNLVFPVRAPRIAIIAGPGVSGSSAGYTWYTLDQRIHYPSTILDPTAVSGATLSDYNVIILPSAQGGFFERMLGDGGRDRLTAWVRSGGTLITLEASSAWITTERVGLSRLTLRRDSVRADSSAGAPLPTGVPGAIVRVVADTLSPLLAGVVEREFPAYIFSDRIFNFPRDVRAGESVLRYAPESRLRIAGYMWPEVPARLGDSPFLWTESVGRGRIISFAVDPNFRDMWRGLLPLFANAVMLGPSM